MHPLLGRQMILYPVELAKSLKPEKIIIVISPGSDELKELLLEEQVEFAVQENPAGTADAVKSALPHLNVIRGSVLILYGDDPLLTAKTIRRLVRIHQKSGSRLSLLTAECPEPCAYGRIIRDKKGDIISIVEYVDATTEQRDIKEVNAGAYCVEIGFLKEALSMVNTQNRQREFYLTDMVEIAVKKGLRVQTYTTADYTETLGVNSREELSRASRALQERINREWMKKGVSIEIPEQVFIGPDVKIGLDTELESGARLLGKTRIGKNCRIQSGARIVDSIIGDDVRILQGSIIEQSRIRSGAVIGPYARIRPGSIVGRNAKIGNFVELKKTVFGEKSSASHLTYLGDAIIGRRVNVGAGTITCNYDGEKKHQTIIGDEAFIGSDSQFVAPVKIGKRAYIASGSTITHNVPADALVIARSRQVIKPGWVKRRRINRH